jgi:hypothetical protein
MCAGLTHHPLSQVWQAYKPRGIGWPFINSQAIRCAGRVFRPSYQTP